MYVRMSHAQCKPARMTEVKSEIERLKDRLHEIPGARHWISLLTDDGELVVMGFFPNKQTCEDSAYVNEKRWAAAADLFQSAPSVSEGEVLAFVST